MGYYTDYKVTKAPVGLDATLLSEETSYTFYDDGDEPYADDIKWYNHDEDMKRISLKFPGEEIHLEGVGEEFLDVWIKVYKDGKLIRKYRGVLEYVEEKL